MPAEGAYSFYDKGPSLELLYFAEVEVIPSLNSFFKNIEKCGSTSKLNEKQSYLCKLAKADIKHWRYYGRSLNINPDTQVLFFGERHLDQGLQIEFSNLLYTLHAKGFLTLAMEMFPKSTQKDLDLYFQGQISLDEIIDVLSKHWAYKKDGYRKILTVAKSLNMKIIGLDDRTNPLKLDFWPEFYQRDSFMAQNLAHEFMTSNSKIVVYTGSLHSMKSFGDKDYEPTLTQKFKSQLQQHSLDIKTQNFILRNTEVSRPYKALTELNKKYKNQNIITHSEELSLYSDGVIYLRPDLEDKTAFLK